MKLMRQVVLQTCLALGSLVLLVPPDIGLVSRPPLKCYSLIIGEARASEGSWIMWGCRRAWCEASNADCLEFSAERSIEMF